MNSLSKTCRQCSRSFTVEQEDLEFYDRVSPVIGGQKFALPAPTLCPECRWIRKAAYRNFKILYHRKSDLSGKPLISIYAPDKPYKVYSPEEWWSDQWDPLSYGRDFDFNRPFFEQFQELTLLVPKPSVSISQCENCTYTNMSHQSKNCYLVFGCVINEDCYYSHILWRSQNCFDMLYSYRCEQCYECVDCELCHSCVYCMDCSQCSDSRYLMNCRSCRNCLGCVNLVNQEYCILNKKYSKEEYEKKRAECLSPEGFPVFYEELTKLYQAAPRRAGVFINCEDVSGNHVFNSRQCKECFDLQFSENCRFCLTGALMKDCYDCVYNGAGQELSYETLFTYGYHLMFCRDILSTSSDLLYCIDSAGIKNCFGCIGLHNREEYCIFNKQYSKEEYERLVPRILEHMQKTGEWGEFFPADKSAFGYNESIASDYYPLGKEEALHKGFAWYDKNQESEINQYVGKLQIPPTSLTNVTEDLTKSIFKCEVTGKPFKVLAQELEFYKTMDLPLPRRCPDQRHMDRMARRNPRRLWDRSCAQCNMPIQTSYSPDRPEKVLCEKCYLKTVY